MNQIELNIRLDHTSLTPEDKEVLIEALKNRKEAGVLIKEDKFLEAMEKTVTALKTMRNFSDYKNPEFRLLFVALLFDLAEILYWLKNYKQSEKEVELLFKVLDNLVKTDEERFGQYHILAMELSTRILRSRKKTLDLLVKQKITTDRLYEKVNSGISGATDKLVESLCTTAKLLAASGDIREALKFFAEAIKFSKKRTGKVTRKEVTMTVEMAETMIRLKNMQPRARRLLTTILPHAQALGMTKEQKEIKSLIDVIDASVEPETKWRLFLHKVISSAKSKLKGKEEAKG